MCLVVLGLGVLLVAGCSGRTTGASHHNSSNNTIRLNAIGSCDTTCTALMRFRVVGSSAWTNTPSFNVPNKVTNAPWSRTVTVFPGAKYEYQACGKESSQSQFFCAGPDGTSATTEKFTAGPLQARTTAATKVYDIEATLNGELSSTSSRRVTYWFEYGKTTAYGSREPFSSVAVDLAANLAKPVAQRVFLTEGTTYHYRVCLSDRSEPVENPTATLCGADQTFKTNVGTKSISCGQTITSNTTLGTDLNGCPDQGLVIGASNITLDLNGHTIEADGQIEDQCNGPGAGDWGIANAGGYDRVTVKNGAILGFEEGLISVGAADSVVHDLRLQALQSSSIMCQGIYLQDSDRAHIYANDVPVPAIVRGIGVIGGTGHTVETNTVISDHAGIALWASGSRVAGNAVCAEDFGIELVGADTNTIVGNTTHCTTHFDGIVMAQSNDNVVDRNTVSDVHYDSDPTEPSQFAGIEVVDHSSRNKITNNTVFNNDAPGIAIGILNEASSGASDANTVSGNTSHDNSGGAGSDGIIVGLEATNTLVELNTVYRNGDDGIDVDKAGTTLRSNTATNNSDWGIEAVAGILNGGGNRASGNGRAAQCLNITCSP